MAEACVKLTEVGRETKCARCDYKRASLIAALEAKSHRLRRDVTAPVGALGSIPLRMLFAAHPDLLTPLLQTFTGSSPLF
jgi:hypothetical protein